MVCKPHFQTEPATLLGTPPQPGQKFLKPLLPEKPAQVPINLIPPLIIVSKGTGRTFLLVPRIQIPHAEQPKLPLYFPAGHSSPRRRGTP